MKYSTKNLLVDKNIEDLLDVTYIIQDLYDKLSDDEEFYQNMEYLKLCIELENNYYQKLNYSINELNQFCNRISYLNSSRVVNKDISDLVVNRIQNHLINMHCINPFLSSNKDSYIRNTENELTISVQYFLDYNSLVIYLLNERIMSESNDLIKCILKKWQLDEVMKLKIKEEEFFSKKSLEVPILENREKLILFGHDSSLVDRVYLKEAEKIIMKAIYDLRDVYFYPNESVSDNVFKEFLYINIKSSLYMLNSEEVNLIMDKILAEDDLLLDRTGVVDIVLSILGNIDVCRFSRVKSKK